MFFFLPTNFVLKSELCDAEQLIGVLEVRGSNLCPVRGYYMIPSATGGTMMGIM
jgi:hypothetical protein